MKAVNQLLAGVHIATMGEAMAFGMTQGVSPDAFLEVISQCAGTSWMLENRAPHVVDGDYTPRSQINIWPKDLGIVLDIAKDAGFSAPITATALQQYMVAVGMGLGAEDDAAMFHRGTLSTVELERVAQHVTSHQSRLGKQATGSGVIP